jgi:hypothetical protein
MFGAIGNKIGSKVAGQMGSNLAGHAAQVAKTQLNNPAKEGAAKVAMVTKGIPSKDAGNLINGGPLSSLGKVGANSLVKGPKKGPQEAFESMQKNMQKQSLMNSVLTNTANMKHEALKGIASNLRG